MKTKIITILAVLFTITFQAQAYVLTFDDISLSDSAPIPDGYGGFNWGNLHNGGAFYYLNAPLVSPDSGYANGVVSGSYVAFPTTYTHEGIGWLTSADLFTFNGAYFTAAWRDGLNVQVDGYLNEQLIYTTTVVVDTIGPTWCQFNYESIDELRFSAFGGTVHEGYQYDNTHFVIDNFTYIPEPTTLLLYALGVVLLRKRHSLKLKS